MKWECEEPGWYRLYADTSDHAECLAAVCLESGRKWCVYIDKDMPPGDSQHRSFKEAKIETERRIQQPLKRKK